MFFIDNMESIEGALLVQSRRSIWDLAYSGVMVIGCVGYYWLDTLGGANRSHTLLYLAGAFALWGLLSPFSRRLTLIDWEYGELIREKSLFVTYHRSQIPFAARSVRLEREEWYGSDVHHNHYYRLLLGEETKDIHIGRVTGGMRALALAEEIAGALDLPLEDDTENVKRVFPLLGSMLTCERDRERHAV